MKVPLSWLREYVDVDLPVGELAHRLTMAGVEVGDTVEIGDWQECFVGRVLRVQPSPDANRVWLCRVEIEPGDRGGGGGAASAGVAGAGGASAGVA